MKKSYFIGTAMPGCLACALTHVFTRCAGGIPVLFLLAGWPALVTPLHAQNPPTYVFQIDSNAVPGAGFSPYLWRWTSP